MYYDLTKILSYNAFLNILIGGRGIGKTYSCSKFVTKQFIKKGEQFAYIRRYKSDLKKSVPKFFEALNKNEEFPGHKLYTKGDSFFIDDKQCGYAFTLSTAQDLKSSNFSNVKYIIFDEFILEEGQKHYIKNEVESLLGLIETIARLRDIKIFMLANAVTIANPYFIYFDLSLPYGSDIKTFKDGLILVNYIESSEEFIKTKKNSNFGKLIEGTEFGDYAINNTFRLDNKTFVEKKTGSSKCSFYFQFQNKLYGVWFDFNAGKIFVSEDYNPNVQFFACTKDDQTPNTMLISEAKNYSCWKIFVKNYKLGNVYFESLKIKQATLELLRIMLIK